MVLWGPGIIGLNQLVIQLTGYWCDASITSTNKTLSPLPAGLSSYNIESLTVDHSGCHACKRTLL